MVQYIILLTAILTLNAFALGKMDLTKPYIPGEFVVKLNDSINKAALLSHDDFNIVELIDDDLAVVARDQGEKAILGIRTLQRTNLFKIVEPNFIYTINEMPNDPNFNQAWGLYNFGQIDSKNNTGVAGVDINALAAWDFTTGSPEIIVGIVDTGVNYLHPDLKSNIWTNLAEQNGVAGVDDDGNGYIDDIHGYDFIANKPDPMDDHGHGSHVAGVIGASGNNGVGISGINWKVKIMALKFMGSHGGGSLSSAIKAIRYGTKMGAHITNNSWGGGGHSQLLKDTIQEAYQNSVLFVAAAGNDGENSDLNPKYPANYQVPNIISVAAIDNRGRLANFSNYGTKNVHVAAPGVNIYSTVLGSQYESMSGTSMASPHVTGVAALLLSDHPSLTVDELKKRIINFAAPLASLRKKVTSEKMVSAYHALISQPAPNDPNDPIYWEGRTETISTGHNYLQNMDRSWLIKVDGAKSLAVKFSRFEIESLYDQVIFYDRNDTILAIWSGRHHEEFSPVAFGDTLKIRLISDAKIEHYGFDISKTAFKY
ncbi:MAG: S8 family serine peptidase [Bdellovibrionales bacterium]|jgi:thermitase|nr:S8 family serine peptidase [Bdellovibrionales bacterium]MBT3527000.1 S8 family serine peptidase [Bdellovibrionales bacterium]MBT7766335.1 S8 family serine peptidase [Bdellovibrionales bacterium]